ncbi:Hpt domain-containing protein, partial [Helicobacter vulpis]|uniref:Hpt domain-containing protein n=1 Tax=Helicobacter vulpis TaxID=2316076 RepID=UPI001F401A53
MDDMREIMEDFLVEAFEMNEQLDQDLVELEHTPQDLDLLNRIFRVAHTIKGSSSFLNLDTLTHLTHNMEDVLNRARKNELQITPDVMDVVLRSVDMMKTLLITIRNTGSDANAGLDISGIVRELQAIAQSHGDHEASPQEAPPPPPQESAP